MMARQIKQCGFFFLSLSLIFRGCFFFLRVEKRRLAREMGTDDNDNDNDDDSGEDDAYSVVCAIGVS